MEVALAGVGGWITKLAVGGGRKGKEGGRNRACICSHLCIYVAPQHLVTVAGSILGSASGEATFLYILCFSASAVSVDRYITILIFLAAVARLDTWTLEIWRGAHFSKWASEW